MSLSQRTFNYSLLGHALEAARRMGILDELHRSRRVSVANLCQRERVEAGVVSALFRVLTAAEVMVPGDTPDEYAAGPELDDVYLRRGYLCWLNQGCGATLLSWAELAKIGAAERARHSRNGGAVALSSAVMGHSDVDPITYPLIARMPFTAICDLGCGDASRLINIVKARADIKGYGIDLNPQAIAAARAAVAEADLSDRISIIGMNVNNLEPPAEAADCVELITMFFMGHDLWPEDNVVEVFTDIRRKFRACRRLLLADVVTAAQLPLEACPIFQLGVEAVHSILRQTLPQLEDWDRVFEKSGWTLNRRITLQIPNTHLFELTPREHA